MARSDDELNADARYFCFNRSGERIPCPSLGRRSPKSAATVIVFARRTPL